MTMYDDNRVVTLLREIDPPLSPPDRLGEVKRRARGHESRRMTALAGLMAVVLVAGVVSALHLGNRSDVQELTVADAVNATQATGSARMTIRITVSGSPHQNLFKGGFFDVTGLADFVHGRYVLKGTSAGQSTETRVIGQNRWTKVPIPVGFGGVGGKPWLHSVVKASDEAAGIFSSPDPRLLLDALTAKGTVVSTKQVGDRRQTVLHLRTNFFDSSPGVADHGSDVTLETDSAGLIRTMVTETTVADLGTLQMTLRYHDFGVHVDVQPPPADQVQEAAQLGSGSSSQQFSVTTSGSGSSSPEDRKRACDQIKAFKAQQPAPKTDAERAQRAQFDQAIERACAVTK